VAEHQEEEPGEEEEEDEYARMVRADQALKTLKLRVSVKSK